MSQFHKWRKSCIDQQFCKWKNHALTITMDDAICNNECNLVWLGLKERVAYNLLEKLTTQVPTPPQRGNCPKLSFSFPFGLTQLVSVIWSTICVGCDGWASSIQMCIFWWEASHVIWKVSSLKFELVRKGKSIRSIVGEGI